MDEQQIVDVNLAPEIADEPNEVSSVASVDIDDDEISIEDDIMNIDDLTYPDEGFDEVELVMATVDLGDVRSKRANFVARSYQVRSGCGAVRV